MAQLPTASASERLLWTGLNWRCRPSADIDPVKFTALKRSPQTPAVRLTAKALVKTGVRQRLVQLDALRRRHGPLLFGVIGQVLDVLRLRAMGAQRGEMRAQLVSG